MAAMGQRWKCESQYVYESVGDRAIAGVAGDYKRRVRHFHSNNNLANNHQSGDLCALAEALSSFALEPKCIIVQWIHVVQ